MVGTYECNQQVGHAAEPWKYFDILHDIETATGNREAALDAWTRARDAYLAYRRQGGHAANQIDKLFDWIRDSVQNRESDKIVVDLTLAHHEDDSPDQIQTAPPENPGRSDVFARSRFGQRSCLRLRRCRRTAAPDRNVAMTVDTMQHLDVPHPGWLKNKLYNQF